MRVLAISVFLLGCDAGAAPPKPAAATEVAVVAARPPLPQVQGAPAYVIQNDADFMAKVTVLLDRLVAVFQQGGKDCDAVERGIRGFGAANRTMLDSLTRYGKEHPSAEKALQQQLEPR